MTEDRLVEVDAAEVLDPSRFAQQPKAVGGLLQQADVECATAEVIDGNSSADGDIGLRRVLRGGRFRFGATLNVAEAGQVGCLVQQIELVRGPVRRVGDHDIGRWTTFAFGGGGDDPLQHPRSE
jgi:hypothetical protein